MDQKINDLQLLTFNNDQISHQNLFQYFFENKQLTQQKNLNIYSCSFCKGNSFFVLHSQVVCQTCDAIQYQEIDYSQEWRVFDDKGTDRERADHVTKQQLIINKGVQPIGGITTPYMHKNFILCQFLKWQSQESYEQSQIRKKYNFIKHLCQQQQFEIPDRIMQDAIQYYIQASDIIKHRGKQDTGQLAACLYLACQNNKCSRSKKEISNMFRIQTKILMNGIKRLPYLLQQINVTQSDEYLARIHNQLKIPKKYLYLANSMYQQIQQHSNIINKSSPISISSSILYYLVMKYNLMDDTEFCMRIKHFSTSLITLNKYINEFKQIESNFKFIEKEEDQFVQ